MSPSKGGNATMSQKIGRTTTVKMTSPEFPEFLNAAPCWGHNICACMVSKLNFDISKVNVTKIMCLNLILLPYVLSCIRRTGPCTCDFMHFALRYACAHVRPYTAISDRSLAMVYTRVRASLTVRTSCTCRY